MSNRTSGTYGVVPETTVSRMPTRDLNHPIPHMNRGAPGPRPIPQPSSASAASSGASGSHILVRPREPKAQTKA
eukprot:4590311-Prorocentrum_lima.AAC.1